MLTPEEVALLKARNYHSLREMIYFSYTLGVNLMKPSRIGNILKLWNVLLTLSCCYALYGHWRLFLLYINDIPRIVETLSTLLQTMMSLVKMVYFLLVQHKFYKLIRRVCSHDLLQECEIFKAEFPVKEELKQLVDKAMKSTWRSTRQQLLFYLVCCVGIICNYSINSIGVNLYHYYTIPSGDFEIILPMPSYYPAWHDKGMTFPFYHIQVYFETCALYAAGIGAFTFDVLFIVLCLHGVGLMRSLCHIIDCSTSPLVPKGRRVEYLQYCIYQYQRICNYAAEVNNCFRKMILIQFLLSLFCLGLVLFKMSVGLSSFTTVLRMLMYLMAAGYQVIIYCYNGQQFTTASEEIPLAFYNSAWYDESREFQQIVKMIALRTNRFLYLDVSWFTRMSLPTMMAMMKISGQYFLLLQNVTGK